MFSLANSLEKTFPNQIHVISTGNFQDGERIFNFHPVNHYYVDETGDVYNGLRLPNGSILQMLNPLGLPSGILSAIRGIYGAKFKFFQLLKNLRPGGGDPFYYGGAIIVKNDEVIYRFESQGPGKHPSASEIQKYMIDVSNEAKSN